MIVVATLLLTGCSTFNQEVAIDIERDNGTVTAMGKGSSLYYDRDEIQSRTLEAAKDACPAPGSDSLLTPQSLDVTAIAIVEVSKALIAKLGSHKVTVTYPCRQ